MARSRGAPARLICLVLLALVAAVCLFATGADARRRRGPPQPCPAGTGNATVVCSGCIKRSCRFDDRCHWAKNLQARQAPCANVVYPKDAGVTEAQLKARNQCLGIQHKHGARAAPIAGGPGNRRVRCQATRIPQPLNKTVACICVTKRGNPAARRCRNCIPSAALKPRRRRSRREPRAPRRRTRSHNGAEGASCSPFFDPASPGPVDIHSAR